MSHSRVVPEGILTSCLPGVRPLLAEGWLASEFMVARGKSSNARVQPQTRLSHACAHASRRDSASASSSERQ